MAMTIRFAALLGLGALALPGCSALGNCPPDGEDVTIHHNVGNTEAGFYLSAPWSGPRDHFPAKTLVHFEHQLGATPEDVSSFVSFSRTGSDFSENTGNQGRFKCVDDHEIVIKNDTCEDTFYIIVSAQASGNFHADCDCDERDDAGDCPESSR